MDRSLAEFPQLNFLLDDMQRTIEYRIDDSGHGEQSTNNRTYIRCEMTERAK